jgi:hypothetical protein
MRHQAADLSSRGRQERDRLFHIGHKPARELTAQIGEGLRDVVPMVCVAVDEVPPGDRARWWRRQSARRSAPRRPAPMHCTRHGDESGDLANGWTSRTSPPKPAGPPPVRGSASGKPNGRGTPNRSHISRRRWRGANSATCSGSNAACTLGVPSTSATSTPNSNVTAPAAPREGEDGRRMA